MSDLQAAAEALRRGAVVAIPTDTVYGLAVDPTVAGSTAALFAVKGRPARLELPVLVASTEQFESLVAPGPHLAAALRLAAVFWPGPLTVVVARRAGLDWALGGDGSTIGVRCPDSTVARALCAEVGPLATTSANRHGEPPCHDAAAVVRTFDDRIGAVVDGGRCERPPSTVVSLGPDGPSCLRPGTLDFDRIAAVAGAG